MGGALVFLVAFAAHAGIAAPAPYLLDSAELAAASFGLGVAHPPGEALALLVGRAFAFLPFGSVAFRVALAQAAAAALASALVFRLVLRLAALLDPDGRTDEASRALAAGAAALVFALAPGVLIVGNRPEVYALQTALSVGAVLAGLRAGIEGDARLALVAALLVGLGLANHPLVAGLAAVGAFVAAAPAVRPAWRRAAVLIALVGVAGALVVAYLPARTAAVHAAGDADAVLWGDARSVPGLAWVLSAETFATKSTVVHRGTSPGALPYLFVEELELAFALLALAGAFFLLRRSRAAGGGLLLAAAGTMAGAFVGGIDPANPDIRGYLGPAIAAGAALAGGALIVFLSIVRTAALRPALAALAVAGALTRLPTTGAYPGLRQARAADAFAGAMLAELPVRAALLTNHFETAFLVAYHRGVEGRRADAAWAHLGFARGPGYAQRIAAAEPTLAPVVNAHASGRLTPGVLATLDQQRPVRLEADPRAGEAVRDATVPDGWTWRIAAAESPRAEALPGWMIAEAARDRQVRGFLGWRMYVDATLACDRRLRDAAKTRVADLQRLLPEDRDARALIERCP